IGPPYNTPDSSCANGAWQCLSHSPSTSVRLVVTQHTVARRLGIAVPSTSAFLTICDGFHPYQSPACELSGLAAAVERADVPLQEQTERVVVAAEHVLAQ